MANDTRAEYDRLQTLTDEELCALAQQGSRDAEEILVGRYHRLVRSCARPYFLAGGDSEDLLQEGMFGLIKAIREYEPGHAARSAPLPRRASAGGSIPCCGRPRPVSICR